MTMTKEEYLQEKDEEMYGPLSGSDSSIIFLTPELIDMDLLKKIMNENPAAFKKFHQEEEGFRFDIIRYYTRKPKSEACDLEYKLFYNEVDVTDIWSDYDVQEAFPCEM